MPYANFVTQYTEGHQLRQHGLDVELMQNFARYLGVKSQFVPATWATVIGKLTGQSSLFIDNKVVLGGAEPILGDVIANGFTILNWRSELIDFSDDYFPSGVWLVARKDSDLQPILPSGSVSKDIGVVKGLIKDRDILTMKQSCLDPDLYNLYATQANVILPAKQLQLNEMVPAILNHEAEATLLDMADALIAIDKWPQAVKVIGPISQLQRMGIGFRKSAPQLRKAFNVYLQQIRADGSYLQLVKKYYPTIFLYHPDYFNDIPVSD